MTNGRRKGKDAELAVASYLRSVGWDDAGRRLAGNGQAGDIDGLPFLVVEVKAGRDLRIPAWLRQLADETPDNCDGVLVVKPVGVPMTPPERVGEWWAIQPLSEWVALWRDAGR